MKNNTCTFNAGIQCDAWDYLQRCVLTSRWNDAVNRVNHASLCRWSVCDAKPGNVTYPQRYGPHAIRRTLDDWGNNVSGTGCQATITGTGADFESPYAVVSELGAMLVDEGYTMDPMLGLMDRPVHIEGYPKR